MSELGAIPLTEGMIDQYAEVVKQALDEATLQERILEPHKNATIKLVYAIGLPVLLYMARQHKNECLDTCRHACGLGYGSPDCYVRKGDCDVRREVRRVDEVLWKAGVRA